MNEENEQHEQTLLLALGTLLLQANMFEEAVIDLYRLVDGEHYFEFLDRARKMRLADLAKGLVSRYSLDRTPRLGASRFAVATTHSSTNFSTATTR